MNIEQPAALKDGLISDRAYTREEIVDFIGEINKQIVGSSKSTMHSLLALNHILRAPNAREVIDGDLKTQLKDIWLKLKSIGLQLQDPPILFGAPQVSDFAEAEDGDSDDE